MIEARANCWISAGAASAIAAKLYVGKANRPVSLVYCQTGSEHPENARFLQDCSRRIGLEVLRLQSEEYRDTWHVWEKERWLAGIEGARCTTALKVEPRLAYQRPDDLHVFGYTADKPDVLRATRLRETYPELLIRTPLIEAGLTKEACLALVKAAIGWLPPMYKQGFQNNNCIPCVKATSPNYWSLVRLHYPEAFYRLAKLARELGVRLCRLHGERAFIDDIPHDWPTTNPIQPSCDFLCALASADLELAHR